MHQAQNRTLNPQSHSNDHRACQAGLRPLPPHRCRPAGAAAAGAAAALPVPLPPVPLPPLTCTGVGESL